MTNVQKIKCRDGKCVEYNNPAERALHSLYYSNVIDSIERKQLKDEIPQFFF